MNSKIDPESRDYSFDQIEDDPRLKRTTKEFFITIIVYVVYAVLMITNLFVLGKNPQNYTYILGFPLWIFIEICLIIGMVVTVELITKFVYKDMDISAPVNEEGGNK